MRGVIAFGTNTVFRAGNDAPDPIMIPKTAIGVFAGLLVIPSQGMKGFRNEIRRAEAKLGDIAPEDAKMLTPQSAGEHMSMALLFAWAAHFIANVILFFFSFSMSTLFVSVIGAYVFSFLLYAWVVLLAVPCRQKWMVWLAQLAVIAYAGAKASVMHSGLCTLEATKLHSLSYFPPVFIPSIPTISFDPAQIHSSGYRPLAAGYHDTTRVTTNILSLPACVHSNHTSVIPNQPRWVHTTMHTVRIRTTMFPNPDSRRACLFIYTHL